MPTTYKAAAVQMHAGADKDENLAVAMNLVEAAVSEGAKLVVLPELFNCLCQMEDVVAQAERIPGPTSRAMEDLARRLTITLVAGSICERAEDEEKGYNTSLVIGSDGEVLSRYRKMHMFDIDLPGEITFRESDFLLPGDEVCLTETPLGKLGQATCYDLRFPELFRALSKRGMEICCFPSAFSAPTGKVHWETLVRARAIENQCYFIAANQYGHHTPRMATYGHSMIVDPWGTILARAEEGDAVLIAEIDLEHLATVRCQLPALTHRRL